MSAILAGEVTRLALCWRVVRRDGVALGFTSHDRDLDLDGFRYRAAPGMMPSAVMRSDGFEPDTMDVRGALSSQAITGASLAEGRWDGAELRLFLIDWSDPEAGSVPLARGAIGAVSMRGSGFEAELRGPTALLEQPVAEQTSPECRAMLGDRRCRVDMAGRVRVTEVAAVTGEQEIAVASASGDNTYACGRLRWLSGGNCGLDSAIASSSGPALVLREPPPRPIAVGDRIELHEGCDKAFGTCAGRFGNAANFRGEPHLPGTDLLTRYPGG